jgi:hypothetical protein
MRKKRYRSAKTGEFVSKEKAEADPDTTVGETIEKTSGRLVSEKDTAIKSRDDDKDSSPAGPA